MSLTARAKIFVSVGFLALISSLLYAQITLPEPPSYQLTAMKVVPFSQRTNLFLDEIKKDRDFSAWNELNLSLFVTVQVTGRAGSYSSKRKVEITAYDDRHVILKRVSDLGVLDEDTGKYYIPVWLYGPFCREVTIKARLLGQSQGSSLQRNLDFQCGE